MNKTLSIIIGVVILLLIPGCSYNKLVTLDLNVDNAAADLQSQYQRRYDLIGNLVATVKKAADYEKATLTQVIEARAKATQIKIDADMINNPDALKKFNEAQAGLSSSLGRLLASFERYPDLKAVKGFDELRISIEGTENRINFSRDAYNKTVKNYNLKVRKFPSNIAAMIFGFKEKAMFKAKEGTEDAPDVNKLFED